MQAAVPLGKVPRRSRDRFESLVQFGNQLVETDNAQHRRGQLDPERQSTHSPTYARGQLDRIVIKRQAWYVPLRALDEQQHRGIRCSHGAQANQPSTIGSYVSSGCVGMLNGDIEDLYSRVQVGTRVVVLPGKAPDTVASGAPPEPANPMAPPANPMAPPARTGSTAISGSPLPPVR